MREPTAQDTAFALQLYQRTVNSDQFSPNCAAMRSAVVGPLISTRPRTRRLDCILRFDLALQPFRKRYGGVTELTGSAARTTGQFSAAIHNERTICDLATCRAALGH